MLSADAWEKQTFLGIYSHNNIKLFIIYFHCVDICINGAKPLLPKHESRVAPNSSSFFGCFFKITPLLRCNSHHLTHLIYPMSRVFCDTPTQSQVSRHQMSINNSILTLSIWREHQIPRVKGLSPIRLLPSFRCQCI